MEDLNSKTAFDIVNRYLGWGDPGEGGIWFVGIEEASGWGESEEDRPENAYRNKLERARQQIRRLEQRLQDGWYKYSCYKPKERKSQVLEVMAEISSELSRRQSSLMSYKTDHLWRAGCKVFQTNLYPLGRPNTRDWPLLYKELFNFGKEDLDRYKKEVKEKRLPNIQSRWVLSKPEATVCFGTSSYYKEMFQYCFLDDQAFPLTEHPSHKIFFNDARRVIICQHPASRWWRKGRSDKEKLRIIKSKLKDEWKVKLP